MKALAVLAATAFVAGSPQPIRHADSFPVFGGHGAWISYSGGAGVVDLAGSPVEDPPSTSSTGRYVVHALNKAPYTVTITWADGTHPHVLTDADAWPSWNGDDSVLVFGQHRGLAVADGDGANIRALPVSTGCESGDCYANLGAPALSPDGTAIAVVLTTVSAHGGPYRNVPGGVAVVLVTGGKLRRVGGETTCEPDANIQWSSDSTWISYLAGDCDLYGNELRVARAADGKGTRLDVQLRDADYRWAVGSDLLAYATKRGVGIAAPDHQLRLVRGAGSPTWAPTGTRLALGVAGQVELLDAPSGVPHAIAIGSSPSWSPTGEWIAYGVRTCGPRQGIHLIRPDGKDDHRLTHVCAIRANGARRITGTPYDDEIVANYDGRETISCGAGLDTVYVDRHDVVARDCERVVRRR